MKTKIVLSLLFVFVISLLPQISQAQIINYEVVSSNNLNGEELIKDLKKKGVKLMDFTPSILNYYDFTDNHQYKYILAIVNVSELQLDNNCQSRNTMEKVKNFGEAKGYRAPDINVAISLREKITNEEMKKMGFKTLVVMHRPLLEPDGSRVQLTMDNEGYFYDCFCYSNGKMGTTSEDSLGFVFIDTKKTYNELLNK